jgi:hypothetical protein
MTHFLLTSIRFERGRSGRLLNVFCFVGPDGPFEVFVGDENLPLTDSRLASYVESSPVLDVMDYYEDDMTRDNYVATNYVGTVMPNDDTSDAIEDHWPERFRRKTLLEAPCQSTEIQ